MKHTLKALVLICAFMLAASNAYSDNLTADYKKTTLENGAVVVARHMPESPLVIIQLRVLSGLSNEGKYASSGISHFLEHLLFKGTADKTSEDIRKEVKMMGGAINASTGLDSAEYHITVPNENFEKALNLLVDMVTSATFTNDEMLTERDVIFNEIRFRNDDPLNKRMQLLFSQAYKESVYKHPIIGYEETLEKLSHEDIIEYHATTYIPERMVLGVVGGVPSSVALTIAEEKLKACEWHLGPQINVPKEPTQTKMVRFDTSGDVTLGYMAIGFHSTDLYSPDFYAGDVFSILLGEGNGSRLYERLVKEKQLLYSVSSLNYTLKYPGLFIITGVGDPEKLEEAREEILTMIKEFKEGTVQNWELERARNLVISDYLHFHERIDSLVSSMTTSQILLGDPAFFEKYVNRINKVGGEGIRDFGFKYLNEDNSTTVFLMPKDHEGGQGSPYHSLRSDTGQAVASGQEPGIEVEEDEEQKSEVKKQKPKKKREKKAVKKKRKAQDMIRFPRRAKNTGEEEVKVVVFENWLKIIVKKKGYLPIVAVSYAAPGGLRAEGNKTNGLSNLTASLVLKGTRTRSEKEMIPAIEKLGGNIGAFSGMDSVGLAMDILSRDLDAGLDIFEDALKNAAFPTEEIAKQKKKIVAALKEQEKDLFTNGMIYLRELLYGKHPYSMRVLGEIETVDSFSSEEITIFYENHFVPRDAVITVVGDVDIDKVIKNLEERFSKWKRKGSGLGKREVIPLMEKQHEDITMEKEESLVLIGFQGVRTKDKKKYILAIISSILSGSDGLLFYAVREKEGLAYTSGAASIPRVDAGYVVLYVATKEENIEQVKSIVFNVLKKITDGDIPEDEITSSKNKLIAQQAYSLETNSSLSAIMALSELYGWGFHDYKQYAAEISAVTKEDIVQYAKELFDLQKSAIVIVHSSLAEEDLSLEPVPAPTDLSTE